MGTGTHSKSRLGLNLRPAHCRPAAGLGLTSLLFLSLDIPSHTPWAAGASAAHGAAPRN